MNAYGYFGATSRLPNIVTIHLWADGIKGIIREYGRTCSSLFALRWSREILNRARNVISISPLVKKRLSVRGRKIRIFDIENAVHPRFFEELASPAEDFALYVGSIVPRKCVLELLEAVHSIGVKLKIVSTTISGEYYLAVREFVTKHNLSGSVEFLGPKRNDELAEIVQRCLFLVLPSKKEMAPMVISEAMAAGKPVVASAVDGIPFMIDDGNTGYLFPVGEIQELAAKMKILFYDRKLCRRMGKKAKDMAMERWHPDIIAHQTVMAYQQVLNGYHR
jgi:glycosyltransferase involved in cell wall biosynthesis